MSYSKQIRCESKSLYCRCFLQWVDPNRHPLHYHDYWCQYQRTLTIAGSWCWWLGGTWAWAGKEKTCSPLPGLATALVPQAATLLTLLRRGPTFLRRNFILPEHENFEPGDNQQYNAEILVLSALRQAEIYFSSFHSHSILYCFNGFILIISVIPCLYNSEFRFMRAYYYINYVDI